MSEPNAKGLSRRVGDRFEVSGEHYNGRPRLVVRDIRFGGRVVVPIEEAANLAGAIDRVLTALCAAALPLEACA